MKAESMKNEAPFLMGFPEDMLNDVVSSDQSLQWRSRASQAASIIGELRLPVNCQKRRDQFGNHVVILTQNVVRKPCGRSRRSHGTYVKL